MKINIWIHRDEVVNNQITKYHLFQPQTSNWKDFVQVSIDHTTFIELEDGNKIVDSKRDVISEYLNTTGGEYESWTATLTEAEMKLVVDTYDLKHI